MEKEKGKKTNDSSEKLPAQKGEEDHFKQKVRAAYSAMGKLGGMARAKQLAEKGFNKELKLQQKNKASNKHQIQTKEKNNE